jgi:O-acetyl-ADP-ribose deacetylase (regulator of RNase III)
MQASLSPEEIVLVSVDEPLARAWDRVAEAFEHVRVYRGSILDLECDAVVSPANSFGFMDGGIDALYTEHFGRDVQDAVRWRILTGHDGELLVGSAEIVATKNPRIPYLIAAPTMRVPMRLPADTVNPYLAARAVLRLVASGTLCDGPHTEEPVREHVKRVAVPGLGTGTGRVSPATCSRQVAAAIRWHLERPGLPPSWAEAGWQHQLLYTDTPNTMG